MSGPDKRAAILREAERIVTSDRNKEYGDPEDSFLAIADLWSAYLCGKEHDHIGRRDVAIMLALMKVARLAANPDHRDSWVDIAGYAACGGGLVADDKPVPAPPENPQTNHPEAWK